MARGQRAIRRILAGTDFSRPASNAVLRAAMLAAEHQASLEIVHVAPRVDRGRLRRLGLGGPAGACADEPCRERLAQAQDLAYSQGVVAAVRLLRGGAPAALTREAKRLSADLVVLGFRGERSLRDALIGTTAERVLERWGGDTLVVKGAPREPYGVLLACVSLAPASCSVVGSALALSAQAQLHVLHAYEPLFEMKLLSHQASGETLARHRAAAKGEAVRGLDELLARCPLPDDRRLERHVRYGGYGGPATLIPGAAARHRADVVVVGRNQSALREFFLGSITKKVVRAARTDVLVSASV